MRENIAMPDLTDDDASDNFYNSGLVGISGTRDVYGCLEGIDKILRENHGLEIGLYPGSCDFIYTILPYREDTVTLYHVEMVFEHHGELNTYRTDVQASDSADAIMVANRVEQHGKMMSVKADAFEVPASRIKDYIS